MRKALDMLDGPRKTGPDAIEIEGFETRILEPAAFSDPAKLRADDVAAYLTDGRPVVRANAATGLGAVGAPALGSLPALSVLLRDDDMRVRIAAAGAIDKLGDDAVKEAAPFLVGALHGDAEVAKAAAKTLGARKARVLSALLKGLETDDETHARRILELVNALEDACEILCDAFDSPAENVQVNAAMGIGMLGAQRAGTAGKKKLEVRARADLHAHARRCSRRSRRSRTAESRRRAGRCYAPAFGAGAPCEDRVSGHVRVHRQRMTTASASWAALGAQGINGRRSRPSMLYRPGPLATSTSRPPMMVRFFMNWIIWVFASAPSIVQNAWK